MLFPSSPKVLDNRISPRLLKEERSGVQQMVAVQIQILSCKPSWSPLASGS